jgi:hypothetical protein
MRRWISEVPLRVQAAHRIPAGKVRGWLLCKQRLGRRGPELPRLPHAGIVKEAAPDLLLCDLVVVQPARMINACER